MPKHIKHTYSRYSLDAVRLLGRLIRIARTERSMTTTELAERAGISRGMLQRIEKGDPGCRIGSMFEVAAIVGVRLFDADEKNVMRNLKQYEDKLTLLPKSVRHKTVVVDDDF